MTSSLFDNHWIGCADILQPQSMTAKALHFWQLFAGKQLVHGAL